MPGRRWRQKWRISTIFLKSQPLPPIDVCNLQWKMRGEFRIRALCLSRASPLLTPRGVRTLLSLIPSFAMPVLIGLAQEEA
jgi:hypothetical protein